MKTLPYGFRIVGATTEERRVVDHAAAFRAYAALDERANVQCESYLSAFAFGEDFHHLLDTTGSVAGFAGPCWSAWLWLDIDVDDDLQCALDQARRLAAGLVERYRLDDDALLLFFSGAKGFHIGLPTALWLPEPGSEFHRAFRGFAAAHAERLGIRIDSGVYDRVRPFRAPNSRHPKTGLHKRRLSFDELLGLSLDAVLQLARTPSAFDVPEPPGLCEQAVQDWQAAVTEACHQTAAKAERQAAVANGTPKLNRLTLEYISEGAGKGERHRLLYSAAANLAEFDCPPALAHALLSAAALDSGLPPKEVRRQIDCGLKDGRRQFGGLAPSCDESPGEPLATPSPPPSEPTPDLSAQLTALWEQSPSTESSVPPNSSAPSPSHPPGDLGTQLAALWEQGTPTSPPSSPVPTSDLSDHLAALWQQQASDAPVPEAPETDGHGDAWEHPLDRLGVIEPDGLEFPFGVNQSGPYGPEGDRR